MVTLHPVQVVRRSRPDNEGSQVSSAVTLRAYEVYSHVHGEQSALVTGRCRGGFNISELTALLYARSFEKDEWKDRLLEAYKGMRLP